MERSLRINPTLQFFPTKQEICSDQMVRPCENEYASQLCLILPIAIKTDGQDRQEQCAQMINIKWLFITDNADADRCRNDGEYRIHNVMRGAESGI